MDGRQLTAELCDAGGQLLQVLHDLDQRGLVLSPDKSPLTGQGSFEVFFLGWVQIRAGLFC